MNVVATLLTIPLLFSLVSHAWESIFNQEKNTPISNKQHTNLLTIQLFIILFYYSTLNLLISVLMMGFLYLVQGAGVLFLLIKKGSGVPCGCFGGQINTRLNGKLVFLNLSLSFLCFFSTNIHFTVTVLEGLMLGVINSLVSLLIIEGIPDARHAIKGFKEAINRNVKNQEV